MDHTVKIALARGVEIGAHVGFPDRQGFGRRPMQIEPAELAAMVTYQLGALAGIARAAGHRMTHMSFHGALGNMTAADAALAGPLVEAVARFDPGLLIVSSASRAIEDAAARCGLRVATTFLADRAYDRDGLLVPRGKPNSVLHDERVVLERVARLLNDGVVETYDGSLLQMQSHSILLHGDTPGAVALGKALRALVNDAGWTVTPVSQLRKCTKS
jgi:5-oxoprolinase (ATP-hydrolysing) subunit A